MVVAEGGSPQQSVDRQAGRRKGESPPVAGGVLRQEMSVQMQRSAPNQTPLQMARGGCRASRVGKVRIITRMILEVGGNATGSRTCRCPENRWGPTCQAFKSCVTWHQIHAHQTGTHSLRVLPLSSTPLANYQEPAQNLDIAMATFRRFHPHDVDKFSKCNLDPLTETYELGFYLQYHAKWPSLFQVCEDKDGNIVGYSALETIRPATVALIANYVWQSWERSSHRLMHTNSRSTICPGTHTSRR